MRRCQTCAEKNAASGVLSCLSNEFGMQMTANGGRGVGGYLSKSRDAMRPARNAATCCHTPTNQRVSCPPAWSPGRGGRGVETPAQTCLKLGRFPANICAADGESVSFFSALPLPFCHAVYQDRLRKDVKKMIAVATVPFLSLISFQRCLFPRLGFAGAPGAAVTSLRPPPPSRCLLLLLLRRPLTWASEGRGRRRERNKTRIIHEGKQ